MFRAALEDYRGSGFDRGHMAAAGNYPTDQAAMCGTFVLTNMVPQAGLPPPAHTNTTSLTTIFNLCFMLRSGVLLLSSIVSHRITTTKSSSFPAAFPPSALANPIGGGFSGSHAIQSG